MQPITAATMEYIDGDGFVELSPPHLLEWREWRGSATRPGLIAVRLPDGGIKLRILAHSGSDEWTVIKRRINRDVAEYRKLLSEESSEFLSMLIEELIPFLEQGVVPWM